MDNNTVEEQQKLKTNRKKILILAVVGGIILAILIFLICVVNMGLKDTQALKQQASELKEQLKATAEYTMAQDYDNAIACMDKVDLCVENINKKLDEPLWKAVKIVPEIDKEIATVNELIDIVSDTSADIIRPSLIYLKENPLSELKVEDGFDIELLMSYIEYAEKLEPKINDLINRLDNITISEKLLNVIDKSGKFNEYKDQILEVKNQYNDMKEYLPVLKAILGNGDERLYMLAAQNSAEIRACGGFPGAIGTIRIKDGILKVGEFKSVTQVLPFSIPDTVKITYEENSLFGNWLWYPRDAEYNPDFERVANIWALSYESMNDEYVDGVVSLTPQIIQEILSTCGEVKISDGTVLNGKNATKVLQHDLYSKYFTSSEDAENSNDIVDSLFSETAEKTMELFTSKFDVKKLKDYFKIFSEGTENRTILLWMAEEKEQDIIKKLGCSGALNTGSPNAVAGVYYSGSDPCKLGWFLDLNTEVSKPVINDDGTRTYKVTVILNNAIDKETIATAGRYIIGNYYGAMRGYIHLFAPVGGNVDNFKTSNGTVIKIAEYNGLELGYSLDLLIYPDTPIEITYEVTTAYGVSEPLTISSTPTLENYR